MKTLIIIGLTIVIVSTGIYFINKAATQNENLIQEKKKKKVFKVNKSDEEWKKELSPEEYAVLRKKGTERPFTGKYDAFFEKGFYKCAACGHKLFLSDTKFDSGCGWPSFFQPVDSNAVVEEADFSHGMIRTEVVCSNCGGHLGHVFEDGPAPTGLRYCINSVSIKFSEEKKDKDE